MMEEDIEEQTLETVRKVDASFLTEEQLQQVRDKVREREKDRTEKLEVHKPSPPQLQQLQRLQFQQIRDTRQEFVPREEASVLPQYLDNVDAELEGHLVTIPVVHDKEFKAGKMERREILDYGDEGEYTHHTNQCTYACESMNLQGWSAGNSPTVKFSYCHAVLVGVGITNDRL